jgi:hypothetical protein
VNQCRGKREAGNGDDNAGDERDGQPRVLGEQWLLHNHASGVPHRRGQAERGTDGRVDPARGGRGPDQERAGERNRTPREELAREALAQQHAREDRDQDRPDVHEHRGRPGVHVVLACIQQDVVCAQPEQAEERHPRQILARRHRFTTDKDDRAERDRCDEQSTERERAG